MRNVSTLLSALAFLLLSPGVIRSDELEIRGTLPWHNFLSGPTAWNEVDYERYLDRMKSLGLNLVAFHCYTGGAERYVTYVEPLIKIEYRNVIPEAGFDTSVTARWGYRPLAPSEFAFDTGRLFRRQPGVDIFGADCAVTAVDLKDRYRRAQELMRKVIAMAHARGIQVALGFEFGIHPPEYLSIVPPDSWIRGAMLPDPTHPAAIEMLHATIDDMLRAYPDLDWVWLWLHEHTMHIGRPYMGERFRELLRRDSQYFLDSGNDQALFTGVWSLEYIRLARDYLAQRAPRVRIAISGWGGGNQLPGTMQGLDRALPKDIVFTCLNPDQGWSAQPAFMAEIAQRRPVWAIPWLEGDASLWHLQPRVALLRDQVRLARTQKLQGVLAIHWRTEEIRMNLDAFGRFATSPDASPEASAFYQEYLTRELGEAAARDLTPLLLKIDKDQSLILASPEYYPYDPSWGRLKPSQRALLDPIRATLKAVSRSGMTQAQRTNLDWWAASFEFATQLDELGEKMEPAQTLRDQWMRGDWPANVTQTIWQKARSDLADAPVESLFRTYASRVRSRGELGVLSALNQKVWLHYLELKQFMSRPEIPPKTAPAAGQPQ